MKKYLLITGVTVLSLLVGVFFGLSYMAAQEHQHMGHGKEVTLEGEVVDLHCYILHPQMGKGESHANCAKMCMNKGLPIGFLTGGKLYLLLGQEHNSAKDAVVEYAGKQSQITGTIVEQNGMMAIQVKSIKGA